MAEAPGAHGDRPRETTETPLLFNSRLVTTGAAAHSIRSVAWKAGLFGVVANLVPFGFGMVITGIMAALLYRKTTGEKLDIGVAARLGTMAGAIAFGITFLLTVAGVILLHAQERFRDVIMKAVEQRAATPADPEMQAALQWLRTPEGFAIAMIFSTLIALLLSMLFSAAGCMVTAALSRDRSGSDL